LIKLNLSKNKIATLSLDLLSSLRKLAVSENEITKIQDFDEET
jgi:Leucine-rich repeat (LRR) protein